MADTLKIVWQKWVNPITGRGSGDRVDEYETDPLAKSEDVWTDSYDRIEEFIEARKQRTARDDKLGPCIVGAAGIIPLNEHNDPAVVYDLWMMHANFEITRRVQDVASSVPGVETWDTITRYRARVGFGKAFDPQTVMYAVQEALGANPKSVETPKPPAKLTTLESLQKHLVASYKAWAIAQLANGRVLVFGRDDEAAVRAQVAHWQNQQPKTLITSWDLCSNSSSESKNTR